MSVDDALKYFTETVTPREFSKIILADSIVFYSNFCVDMFSKMFLLFVPTFGHVVLKNFVEYWNFEISYDSLKDSF